MAKYNIYDTQCERFLKKNCSKKWAIGYAFEIVKDRAEAEDDDLGREFQVFVDNGIENFTFETAKRILDNWDYRLEKIKKKKAS